MPTHLKVEGLDIPLRFDRVDFHQQLEVIVERQSRRVRPGAGEGREIGGIGER